MAMMCWASWSVSVPYSLSLQNVYVSFPLGPPRNHTREQMPRLAHQTLPSRSHRLCAVNSGTALGEESDAQPANAESTVSTAASVILLSATLPFTGTPPGRGRTPGL